MSETDPESAQLYATYAAIVGKRIIAVAPEIGHGVLMICFEGGHTLYVRGLIAAELVGPQ